MPLSAAVTAASCKLERGPFDGFSPVTVFHPVAASGHSAVLPGHFQNVCWQALVSSKREFICTPALSAAFEDRILNPSSSNQEKSEK